jgi:hypothetical protein
MYVHGTSRCTRLTNLRSIECSFVSAEWDEAWVFILRIPTHMTVDQAVLGGGDEAAHLSGAGNVQPPGTARSTLYTDLS